MRLPIVGFCVLVFMTLGACGEEEAGTPEGRGSDAATVDGAADGQIDGQPDVPDVVEDGSAEDTLVREDTPVSDSEDALTFDTTDGTDDDVTVDARRDGGLLADADAQPTTDTSADTLDDRGIVADSEVGPEDSGADGVSDSGSDGELGTADIGDLDSGLDDVYSGCPLDRSGITFQTSRTEPAGVPQRLIIESVNFENDSIVVRNVSDGEIVFTPDSYQLWRVAAGNAGGRTPLPIAYVLPAGGRVRIHLTAEGTDDSSNIYLAWSDPVADLEPDLLVGSEAAVLSPYG